VHHLAIVVKVSFSFQEVVDDKSASGSVPQLERSKSASGSVAQLERSSSTSAAPLSADIPPAAIGHTQISSEDESIMTVMDQFR
jgi:hypothetical protein